MANLYPAGAWLLLYSWVQDALVVILAGLGWPPSDNSKANKTFFLSSRHLCIPSTPCGESARPRRLALRHIGQHGTAWQALHMFTNVVISSQRL